MDPRCTVAGRPPDGLSRAPLETDGFEKVTLLAMLLHMFPYKPAIFMVRQYFLRNARSHRRANFICQHIDSSWAPLRLYDEERSKGGQS